MWKGSPTKEFLGVCLWRLAHIKAHWLPCPRADLAHSGIVWGKIAIGDLRRCPRLILSQGSGEEAQRGLVKKCTLNLRQHTAQIHHNIQGMLKMLISIFFNVLFFVQNMLVCLLGSIPFCHRYIITLVFRKNVWKFDVFANQGLSIYFTLFLSCLITLYLSHALICLLYTVSQ